MLDFQLQQTAFRYGLAEGDDPHAVPFGVLTTLENYVWTKANRIQKRDGTIWLGWGLNVPPGVISLTKRLFTRNGDRELCATNGSEVWSYAQDTNSWKYVAPLPATGLTQKSLIDSVAGVQASDTAIFGGFVVTAYVTGDPTLTLGTPTVVAAGSVTVTVSNLTTGALVMPPTLLPGTTGLALGVRVVIIGTVAIVIFAGSNANIYGHKIDLSTLTVDAAPTTISLGGRVNSKAQNWDAAMVANGSRFVVVFATTATVVGLVAYDATLTSVGTGTQAVGGVVTQISVDAAEGELAWIAYVINQNVSAYTANAATMATVVAPVLIENLATLVAGNAVSLGVCRYDATNFVVTYSANNVNSATLRSQVLLTATGVPVFGSWRVTQSAQFTSNPFMLNGKCYAFATLYLRYNTISPFIGNGSVLVEVFPSAANFSAGGVDGRHPMSAVADTLLGAKGSEHGPLTRMTPLAGGSYVVGSLPFVNTAPSANITWRAGLRLMTVTSLSTVPADMWRAVSRGQETYIFGGVLSPYDGNDVFDYGFPFAPLIFAPPNNVGGAIAAGKYFYATHGEFRSAAGMLYRGPTVTSAILTQTGAASSSGVVISMMGVTNKVHNQGPVGYSPGVTQERNASILPLYRTVADGSIPQRLTEDPSYNTIPLAYSNTTYPFTDTRADINIGDGVSLAVRPALYSLSALDDQAPPASVTGFLHGDRLWLLAGDLRTWWFSKSFGDDQGVAPGFNVSFRIVLPEEQVAGASMDDKAIFFSMNGIRYMLGSGPAKDGTGSDFTAPTRIQTDVGCINPRSVVSVPDGIMFQSTRGIYLLTRGLDLVWIGRPVQNTLAAYPAITSAVLVASKNEIRFTAVNIAVADISNIGGATQGVVMVFNYVEKQWSTFKYADPAVSGVYGCPIVDAIMWNGSYVFALTNGSTYMETNANSMDNTSTYVPGTVETAWVSGAGPVAYQSVKAFWLNGISNSDHDLTVQCGFDSSSAYPQTRTFPACSGVTSPADLEEAKISIGKRRKCNSIRWRITDVAPTTPGSVLGNGRGPTWQTMGFEFGIRKGDNIAVRKTG